METHVKKAIKEISKNKEVIAIILFGSNIKKTNRKDSDIDLAIITKKISTKQELNIRGYSSELIDISLFHKLPIIIQFRVFKEGKVLYCKNKKLLNIIKTNTIKNYLDFSIFMNRFYKRTIENVRH